MLPAARRWPASDYNSAMQNWNIVGHTWAVDYLRRSLAAGRGAQSYLFAGLPGVGKTLLAVRLAQRLVCEAGGLDPCLECRACRRVEHGNHPDVYRMSLATQPAVAGSKDDQRSRLIRVETVRAWVQSVEKRPFEARHCVFILEDASALNEAASNAFLKTLEEPPPHAVFILIAQNVSDILPTIVSRCRVLQLRPLARLEVQRALGERWGLADEDAALLAAWSGGRLGWAVRLVDDEALLEQQQTWLDALVALHSAGTVARLKWAEERAKDFRGDHTTVSAWLSLWQSWWRDVLLVAGGCPEAVTHLDRREDLAAQARAVPLMAIHDFLRRLEQARTQLAANVNPQLALEHLALHLP